MRKALFAVALLGLLAQPVMAQPYSGVTVDRPMTTGAAAPIVCPTGAAVPVMAAPTGCAAPLAPTVKPVTIPKKHWWNRTRTGYVPVCPCPTTGAAAPVCPTGAAAPLNSNLQPVAVPKKWFWESDKVELMPVAPGSATGGAAAVVNDGCGMPSCPCTTCPTVTQPVQPVQPMQPMPTPAPVKPTPTGGAAPVRGNW